MRLTNPLWYLAAFLLALGSAMAATAVAAGAFDPLREATVTPVGERVDAGDKALAVFTDIVQDARDIACYSRGPDNKRIDIPDKGVDITTQSDGTRWHLIGLLEEGRDDLRVACRPGDDRVDNAAYGWATVDDYGSTVNNGQGIAILGATIGAALAAFVFWCRRSARRAARQGPVA